MLKGISRVGLVAFSGLLVACAGGVRAETNPKSPTAGVASADPLKARELIRDSEKALMKKKFDKARDLLRQAEPFADPSVRDEIREMSDRVDKADAKSLVGDANEEAKDGKCGRALDDTAALVNMKGKGPGFPDFVREFTLEANQACLVGMAESPDKLRDARLLGGTQNAKEALGPKVYAALQAGYAALQAGEEKQQQERAAGNRELWLESAPERCAAALNKGYCSKAPDGTTEAESARCNTACAEAMQKGFQSRVQSALEVCGDGYVETDGKRVAFVAQRQRDLANRAGRGTGIMRKVVLGGRPETPGRLKEG